MNEGKRLIKVYIERLLLQFIRMPISGIVFKVYYYFLFIVSFSKEGFHKRLNGLYKVVYNTEHTVPLTLNVALACTRRLARDKS